MSEYALIIMAAGIGSRFGGLKQIEPVGPHGENTIEYSIFDALRAGYGKIVFVITKNIEEQFRNRIGKKIEKECETIYVFQDLDELPSGYQPSSNRGKPWGTAHAVLSCRHVIKSPFTVINADDYYGPSSYRNLLTFMEGISKPGNQHCMVGYNLENTLSDQGYVSRGLCKVDSDGFLKNIQEITHIKRSSNLVEYSNDGGYSWIRIAGGSIVSMNFWGFQANIFTELEQGFYRFLKDPKNNLDKAEYFLPSVVQALIQDNLAKVRVLTTQDKWFGVTYQEDLFNVKQEIKKLIQHRVYPEQLWSFQ